MSDMGDMDRRLRDLLNAAAGEPPHRITAGAVRRRVTRRRVAEWVAGTTAVAAVAVLVPVGIGAAGPGPAGRHRPGAGPTVYVDYVNGDTPAESAVIPISLATNTAGQPITVGTPDSFGVPSIAITPDGKTAYVVSSRGRVIPISTATDTSGKPIYVGRGPRFPGGPGNGPASVAITPDGKTAYVTNAGLNTVIPISTATNIPGQPIPVGRTPNMIAITPDGKTAYVVNDNPGHGGTVTPISTATNTPGTPIPVGPIPSGIAITPDGKTVYVINNEGTVTPISTATNTPGQPIHLHGLYGDISITPDGKTAYATTFDPGRITPISTVTNTAGNPLLVRISNEVSMDTGQIAITPDGKTVYVVSTTSGAVIPISTATNTPGKPIQAGQDRCADPHLVGVNLPQIAITPDGKTAYLACQDSVIPISTATNTAGKPIPVRPGYPSSIAITP